MGRKKVQVPDKVESIIEKYIDPTNEQAVRIEEGRVFINTTQVPFDHIKGLRDELTAAGVDLVTIDQHANPPEETE